MEGGREGKDAASHARPALTPLSADRLESQAPPPPPPPPCRRRPDTPPRLRSPLLARPAPVSDRRRTASPLVAGAERHASSGRVLSPRASGAGRGAARGGARGSRGEAEWTVVPHPPVTSGGGGGAPGTPGGPRAPARPLRGAAATLPGARVGPPRPFRPARYHLGHPKRLRTFRVKGLSLGGAYLDASHPL